LLQASDAAAAVAMTTTSVGTWTDGEMVGRCYQHRCGPSDELFVKLALNSPWILCPYDETVMVVNVIPC